MAKPGDDWEVVEDEWEPVADATTEIAPITSARQPSPSFLSSISEYIPQTAKDVWSTINEPLIDVTPYGRSFAEQVTTPTLADADSYWMPRIKGFVGGAAEGVSNILSSLTTPLNIATAGAMGGAGLAARQGLPAATRGLSMIGRGLSAPVAAHGAITAADPTLTPSERMFGVTELAGGLAGMKAPAIKPRVGARAAAFADEVIPPEVTPEVIKPTLPPEFVAVGEEPPIVRQPMKPAEQTAYEVASRKFGVEPIPEFATETATPEVITAPDYTARIEAGEKIPDFNTVAENGSIWVENLYGKGAGGYARPEDLAFIYDTARMSGKTLPEPPPEIAVQLPESVRSAFEPRNVTPEAPVKTTGDPEIDAILQKFGIKETPIEVVDEAGNVINASAESAASAEALSRQAGMRGRGEQYVVYDRAGNERPIIGPEAVDFEPAAGETYGIKKADGTFIKLTDKGGKVPATVQKVVSPRKKEYPGFKGQVTEATPEITAAEMPDLRARLEAATAEPQRIPTELKSVADNVEAIKQAPEVPNQEKQGILRELLGFNKALLTAYDLSAPGRQGKAFILNKAWWTSLDDMFRAWGSPEAAKAIAESIESHPSGYFRSGTDMAGKRIKSFAERAGLDLADFEEAFNSKLREGIEKYSGIGKSSRAHTAFLNKLRSDQFVSLMDQAKKAGMDPETNLVLAKGFAKFINDATGRGSVNVLHWKLERNMNILNDIFFAPKNMAGQIRTWNAVLNPLSYYQHDPVLRKQALRSLFAIAGTGLAVGEMARIAGASVSNDPTSSDFRKIKVGDTRIDMFGGYQQFPVAAMRLLTGEMTSSITGRTTDLTAGRFGRPTRASVAERFFINRLAPLPSFVWAWMNNREFDGQPFEAKRALFERTLPIALKDIAELAQEDPVFAAIMTPSTIAGLTGTQTYTGR